MGAGIGVRARVTACDSKHRRVCGSGSVREYVGVGMRSGVSKCVRVGDYACLCK